MRYFSIQSAMVQPGAFRPPEKFVKYGSVWIGEGAGVGGGPRAP